MFCRLRQCRQILPKLNLSAILLLFLIKRAALGNLKVNFHCAHLHRFFPLKKALSKTHQSSLSLKGGSTSHLGLLPSGKKRKPLLSIVFTTPSVPLAGDRNPWGRVLNPLPSPRPFQKGKGCNRTFSVLGTATL